MVRAKGRWRRFVRPVGQRGVPRVGWGLGWGGGRCEGGMKFGDGRAVWNSVRASACRQGRNVLKKRHAYVMNTQRKVVMLVLLRRMGVCVCEEVCGSVCQVEERCV